MPTTPDRSRRREVMRRSQALGHCICDVRKPCPCDTLLTQDRCPCAGERPAAADGDAGAVRLTRHTRNAGCASKVGKAELERLLAGLPDPADPRVLVGRATGDDAAVVEIAPGVITVHTVDVFTPPVDDPYTFGRIAAANSVSDIYAMGATPVCALSIIGFPVHDLPGAAMREILRGGIDCLAEAGVSVVGGHTLNDGEVKAGFAVTGICRREQVVRNAGCGPGDVLFLSKPLGGGFLGFAQQLGRCPAEGLAAWTAAMATLNRDAAAAMTACGATAGTDVTGFGLLGHLGNIARHSDALVELDVDALPLFPGVRELARAEVWPGAVERNREALDPARLDWDGLAPAQRALLIGPETSGGILAFIPAARADEYARRCTAAGVATTRIGRVAGPHPGGLIRATTRQAQDWSPMSTPATPAASACCAETPSCCAEPAAPAAPAGLPAAASAEAFRAYMAAVTAPGALDARTKKLMALALSVAQRCGDCVLINAKAARAAGASEAQLAEAAALGIAFGGAPSAQFYRGLGVV